MTQLIASYPERWCKFRLQYVKISLMNISPCKKCKYILIGVGALILIVLLFPVPYYFDTSQIICKEGGCPQSGWYWQQPLIVRIWQQLKYGNRSEIIKAPDQPPTKVYASSLYLPLPNNIETVEDVIALIKAQYPEVAGIKTIGKSMGINSKKDPDGWRLRFWQGWGDCEAGCINDREWYFKVTLNGQVTKVGEWERIHNSRKNSFDEKGIFLQYFLEDCPEGEYVDCMPPIDGGKREQCSSNYPEWAKANCPNFKGAAY